MNLFSRKKLPTSTPEVLQRASCSGCSSCFSAPIESLPANTQKHLEGIREKLIAARESYLKRDQAAVALSRQAKGLIRELSSAGDYRKAIDSMFAAHVPEAEIQQFIARA